MWSPPNIQALPSQDEIKYAREAINELESELERAKRLVAALTQDLEERKAWVAPVRKVPFEILSEIFIFTSKVDDLSPVTITEVCCFWPKVILSTPRAWSLIYADKLVRDKLYTDARGLVAKGNGLPAQYFSTFIQRSNPCMLHISMPEDNDEHFEGEMDNFTHHPAQKVIVSAIHRVQCLSTSCGQIVYLGPEVFPNLTGLKLFSRCFQVVPRFFNRSRFPCLRYLDCTNCPLDDSPAGTISLPPLQYLAVNVRRSDWIELVRGCAGTLVTLDVFESTGVKPIPGGAIGFPKLNSLAFGTRSNVATDLIWPIQATTPSLRSYEQRCPEGRQHSVDHHDVKNVTHVRTNQNMDLEEFVALRVLQVELHGHNSPLHVIRPILHRLEENDDLCPVLQTIRFSLREEDYGDSFKSLIPGFDYDLRTARPGITIYFTDKAHTPLPGSFEEAECGRDMPCALNLGQL